MLGLTAVVAGVVLLGAPAVEQPGNYYAAYKQARSGRKMLLVDFGTGVRIDGARGLDRHVVCRLPADYRLPGAKGRLLDVGCFSELGGQPGVAVIDLTGGPYNGDVVSVLPQRHCSPEKVAALLALPPGSLTQRTLTWAFLIHPERPQSVYAAPCPQLMAHCERHSARQAAMNNQHHDMGHPGRAEIVAESWPWNKNVVDAAIDIVWSWRQSPAHWGAARQTWSRFGYDMKTNGEKWFATGVFE
jgi:hypothetical protein